MLLMADKGLCGGIDAEIEWKLFGTGPAIVNAFEKKEIDLAYLGLPPAIIGIARGVPIVCVAGGHIEGTVVCGKNRYRGYPELRGLGDILKQFIGMTIGVPGKGSIHDVILQQSIRNAGLGTSVSVRNFAWADMVLEAIIKDEVAAAFGTPALGVAIMRYADGIILYPPSLLWPNNPSYGILVDKAFLRDHPVLIEQFLRSHEAATESIRNHPAEAAEAIARHIGFIDASFVTETFSLSPHYCAQLTGEYIASTMDFVKMLHSLGYIRRTISSDDIFDRSLISRVHPEPAHYRSGIAAA
jgi:NitT/TauT family transport system substrate-binding protein